MSIRCEFTFNTRYNVYFTVFRNLREGSDSACFNILLSVQSTNYISLNYLVINWSQLVIIFRPVVNVSFNQTIKNAKCLDLITVDVLELSRKSFGCLVLCNAHVVSCGKLLCYFFGNKL